MKGRLNGMSVSLEGELLVTLSLPKAQLPTLNKLMDKDIEVSVKRYSPKRSLTANAYAWALIGKLAEKLRPISVDELYLMMLKRYGQNGVVAIDTASLAQVLRTLKHYEVLGEDYGAERPYTHVRVIVGSSQYDSREMALFIDGIVSECKEQDIETLPPHELEQMTKEWEKYSE